jgi:hypothetical protein
MLLDSFSDNLCLANISARQAGERITAGQNVHPGFFEFLAVQQFI